MTIGPYSPERPQPPRAPLSGTADVVKSSAIRHYLHERFPQGSAGSCRLVVMRKGEVLFSYSTGPKMDEPQHFGSVSKQFTAASVLSLQQQGKIDLQQDIHVYLPHLPPFTYRGKPVVVTVDDLLQMRSGLPDCINLAFLRGINDQNLSQIEKMAPLYRSEGIELAFSPQARFHYCNSNYYLLNDLVQAVSGQDLRTFAHNHVFQPIGMTHTDFIDPNKPILEQSIPGFAPNGTEMTTKNKTCGACGVIGTPQDMVLWDASLPQWNLLTEEPPEGSIYSRGLHIEHVGPYRVIYHPGGIEGFQTMYLRLECLDGTPQFSIFLASNRDGEEADKWAEDIADIYLGQPLFLEASMDDPPPPPAAIVSHNRHAMEPHVGRYYSPSLDVTHVIELVEPSQDQWVLKMSPAGAPERFSFYFAQDAANSHHYYSVGRIKGAELHFTESGFVFSDPNVPIPPIQFFASN